MYEQQLEQVQNIDFNMTTVSGAAPPPRLVYRMPTFQSADAGGKTEGCGARVQVSMAMENIEMTKATVDAMKTTAKEFKKSVKAFDITSIENLQDDLADMMEDANEVQDILGQSFGVPDGMDDDALNAELDMLEDDLLSEDLMGAPAAPSYVAAAAPSTPASDADDLRSLEASMAM